MDLKLVLPILALNESLKFLVLEKKSYPNNGNPMPFLG